MPNQKLSIDNQTIILRRTNLSHKQFGEQTQLSRAGDINDNKMCSNARPCDAADISPWLDAGGAAAFSPKIAIACSTGHCGNTPTINGL
jgi:hypothetical protein